ncbi:MAG: 1-aminocyclopropane-1-carboxylate deaminase/D-cysteine desulfhydrase [Candidatus Thorarchaeota archaeon]|jgi:D-cysteine desulfhydrase
MFNDLPRERFAFLPTPLHRMKNLGESLGIDQLWIKRDDLTGLSIGGNKTRKLEFVLADAKQAGADTIVTVGGVQSNHCRQTAAATAITGLRCILLLAGEEPEKSTGNLLLDKLYGAEIKYFPDDDFLELNNRLDEIMETLQDLGLIPYAIPAGASMPLGSIGYAQAMFELKEQMATWKFNPKKIIVAAGTGGTLAGMLLGAHAAELDVDIVGVSIVSKAPELEQWVTDLVERAIYDYPQYFESFEPKIIIDDQFLGEGYGIMSDANMSAIEMFAKLESILLDPVYTSKAGTALIRMALAGDLDRKTPTLFWHTGGSPEIFTHSDEFFQ